MVTLLIFSMTLPTPYNSGSVSKDNLYCMIRVIANRMKGLRIIHINAQSIKNKIDEFRYLFSGSGVDIICISETWLWPDLENSLFELQGYQIFRADRGRLGGGVAMYVRREIPCRIVTKSNEGESIELLFVELACDSNKLLAGVVYRPNSRSDLGSFVQRLENLTLGYSDVIICGDFNYNVLNEVNFVLEMKFLGLELVNRTTPTHHSSTSHSLIDLFFVSCKEKVTLYDQLSAPVFSKHELCLLTYDFQFIRCRETFTYRNFKDINYQNLHEDIISINWNTIYNLISVDEQVEFLQSKINSLYDKYVPLKTKIILDSHNPWFDREVKLLIAQRNMAYSRWRKFKITEFYDKYRRLRNKVTFIIRCKKMDYFGRKFSEAINSKDTWKHIKSLGIGNCRAETNFVGDPDKLNEMFVNIPMQDADQDFYRNRLPTNNENTFDFIHFSQNEIYDCIYAIKSNATGSDGIDPKFIKIIYPYISSFVCYIFNTILLRSTYPKSWKHSKIIPIPKNNSEYRPIAILPFLSKVFEKLLNVQIRNYIHNNQLLSDFQSGFRPKHSCLTALQKVSEDLRMNIDKRYVSCLVLLDHSKAFDTVDHEILLLKLKSFFNFSSHAHDLMSSYLCSRSQSVFIKGVSSKPLPVTRGVPQGSILGPLMYSLYSNDLPSQLNHAKIHMYADDVQIYISAPEIEFLNCVSQLNSDLKNVEVWAKTNGLSLNPIKSKCIIIGTKSFIQPDDLSIKLSNTDIAIVNNAINLGVIFNNRLTWCDQIRSAVGKTYGCLRNLYVNSRYTPLNIRLLLAKTYMIPKLLYACELFSSCNTVMLNKLNVAFNNIVRYVFGIRGRDHISQFAKQLYGVSFENLLKIKTLLSLHKIVYTGTPVYLFEFIRFSRSTRGNRLIQLRHNRQLSDYFFFINAIRLWNNLPLNIQTITNDRQFKMALFNHFRA